VPRLGDSAGAGKRCEQNCRIEESGFRGKLGAPRRTRRASSGASLANDVDPLTIISRTFAELWPGSGDRSERHER
jgi:hypothetical protein